MVGPNRPGFAERADLHGLRRDLLLHQIREYLLGASFRQSLIPFIVTDAIGVSLDRNMELWLRGEDAGDTGEPFASDVGQTRAPGNEEDVGHHHDEAASGLARLEKHVQLFAQLL